MKRIVILILLLILCLSLSGCITSASGPEVTPVATPIVVQRPEYFVARGDVSSSLQVSGRVTPVKQQNIFFTSDGVIKEVLIASGDMVQKGTVLARLDAPERYLADVTSAQLELSKAKLDLEEAIFDTPIALAEANQKVVDTEKDLSRVRQNYQWATINLNEAGIAKAKNDLDLAQAEYDKAVAEVTRLAEGNETSPVHLAELALRAAQAKFDLANQALTSIELQAPFDGQIIALGVAPGSTIKAFQNIMTLADPSDLEISAIVDTAQMASIAPGQVAQIKLSSLGEKEISGKIVSIPLLQDGNSVESDRRIHISIEDRSTLRLGDSASIRILLDSHNNVLFLPPAAIRTFQGESFVIVDMDGVQRRVNVVLGLRSTDRVEIISGLEEGQKVIGQ